MKELIIVCLIIMLVILLNNLQKILTEQFSNLNNHNCPPFSVTHNPHNSYMTHVKGWCTTKDYNTEINEEDDFDSFEKSKVKCPYNYSRISANESSLSQSKAYCKTQTL